MLCQEGMMQVEGGGDLPYIEEPDGTRRVLASLAPRPDFGGLPRWASAMPVIPRSDWVDRDYAHYNAPILDQGQRGSCTGQGGVSAFWRQWLILGRTPREFSACYIYGNINGGRDAGAIVSDVMTTLMSKGVCLLSEVPEGMIYRRSFPSSADATAQRFRVARAYHCATFDELGSALQRGFMVVFGIMVGGSFGNLDSEGVAPVGGMGGHCLMACGMKKSSRHGWILHTQNSWGTRWGLNGYCYLTEKHFTSVWGGLDAFAIQDIHADPQEPDMPEPMA